MSVDVAGRLIAIANMKGGVGKTTTVVMLAEAFAANGASVLVVDLDPQASASVSLIGDSMLAECISSGSTVDAFLAISIIQQKQTRLETRIKSDVNLSFHQGQPLSISLLPAGPFLRLVEREIIHELTQINYTMKAIEGRIWRLFRDEFLPLARKYDYVLFDCAPGISPLTEVAVRTCDLVLVTSIPDFLSTYGLAAFFQMFWGRTTQSALLPPTRRPHVLATRFQRSVAQHRATLARLRDEAHSSGAFVLLETCIPQSAALASALVPRDAKPTFSAKYGSLIPSVIAPLLAELDDVFM